MIIHGDSIKVLRTLEPESVDAVVTDPPYGLGNTSPKHVAECLRAWSVGETWQPTGRGFMGRSWDAWVPPPELWREVLRVLKPGGHAIVFAGSRTQDLMSVALRLAGFEIRDTLMWLYGSGFPKSLNVSKAIDKWGGAPHLVHEVARALKEARERRGVTVAEADRLFCDGSTMYSWFEGRPRGHRIPNDETFARIVAAWPELAPLAYKLREAPREVIGEHKRDMGGIGAGASDALRMGVDRRITASATDEARKWEGWGTALKPAYEPAILARKPLNGTVARCVLEHGTGAINIDASRVGERFPANVMIDEYVAHELGERARYFYSPKASKAEREAGLEGFEKRRTGVLQATANGSMKTVAGNERTTRRANTHPTVKPIELMRYLVRMVTPPSGTVLDPFAGSGSTLCAAALEGFNHIGVEREEEYVTIARARVAHWTAERERETIAHPTRAHFQS